MEVVVAIVTGVFTLAAAILSAWLAPRLQRTGRGDHQEINCAAYEMAYRGTLHQLAARYKWNARDKSATRRELATKRKAFRLQEKAGRAWVMVAGFQHKRSSRAGVDDAINDIKSAVLAAAGIDSEFRADHNFVERYIGEKLQTRLGHRPAHQIIQTQEDAALVAKFFQEDFQGQMRRLLMGYSIGQWLGALVLFATAGVMTALAPSVWSGLNELSPALLSPDLLVSIKILYVAVVTGFVGGSISLLLLGR